MPRHTCRLNSAPESQPSLTRQPASSEGTLWSRTDDKIRLEVSRLGIQPHARSDPGFFQSETSLGFLTPMCSRASRESHAEHAPYWQAIVSMYGDGHAMRVEQTCS